MISQLLAKYPDRRQLKIDDVKVAAETDRAQGFAKAELSHSDDVMLPFETVTFTDFIDKAGDPLATGVEVTITTTGGEYLSPTQKAEGVTHEEIVTIRDAIGPIRRWTEESFYPRHKYTARR